MHPFGGGGKAGDGLGQPQIAYRAVWIPASGTKSGKPGLAAPRNNSDERANVQGNGIPCSDDKIPCSAKKIPCSCWLRELGCKPLIYLIDWTQKTPQRAESEKIPC
jgi:hypothetical protein